MFGPTTTADEGGRLAWSPDGRTIAYLLGDELKYSAYDQNRLAVIPAGGGPSRTLTDALDRPVRSPLWTSDGSILVTIVDDRAEQIAKVNPADGRIERLTTGPCVVNGFTAASDGGLAVIASTPSEIPEIYALESGKLLSRRSWGVNRALRKWLVCTTTSPLGATTAYPSGVTSTSSTRPVPSPST